MMGRATWLVCLVLKKPRLWGAWGEVSACPHASHSCSLPTRAPRGDEFWEQVSFHSPQGLRSKTTFLLCVQTRES